MKPSSKTRPTTSQTGYALILLVLGLMAVGGVVIAGFTQQAREDLEVQRYQHNQRVLEQAKRGLLMFAYNYPQTNIGIGPGRLPCPDVDNDGSVDGAGTCAQVGRFPWDDDRLGTPELLDASGERLWYAVSDAFDNIAGGGVINSDTTGTITLVDQSGGIIYDGAVAGIAAVIIAPGTILKRDDDRDKAEEDQIPGYEYTQLRNSDDEKKDSANYLDTFRGFDNSVFTNGESDTDDDGFIMGPIYDVTENTIVVNDQLIIVTADEIIAMAEKATLQAYSVAINDYLSETGGVYPWLYNYDGIEYDYDPDPNVGESVDVATDKLSSYFPAGSCSGAPWRTQVDCVGDGKIWDASFVNEKTTYLGIDTQSNDDGIFGRIPAIFGEYFGSGTTQKIDSGVIGEFEFNFSTLGAVASTGIGNVNFDDDDLTLELIDSVPWTDIGFKDLDGTPGEKSSFTATLADSLDIPMEVYFFQVGHEETTGTFSICPAGGDDISDCHRNSGGGPQPGGSNDTKISVLRVSLLITIPAGTITIDTDHAINAPTGVAVTSPATGTSHARIEGKYDITNVLPTSNMPGVITVSANYEYDGHYHENDTALGDDGHPSVFGTLTVDDLLIDSDLTINMRYFLELPGWAFTNGWHNSIRMVYALEHAPGNTGTCLIDSTCLQLYDSPGKPRDKISLLIIAGTHDWIDDDANGRLKNDLDTVFDSDAVLVDGNSYYNHKFYRHLGNDKILVIEELP